MAENQRILSEGNFKNQRSNYRIAWNFENRIANVGHYELNHFFLRYLAYFTILKSLQIKMKQNVFVSKGLGSWTRSGPGPRTISDLNKVKSCVVW